jgi:hypothetical protein
MALKKHPVNHKLQKNEEYILLTQRIFVLCCDPVSPDLILFLLRVSLDAWLVVPMGLMTVG